MKVFDCNCPLTDYVLCVFTAKGIPPDGPGMYNVCDTCPHRQPLTVPVASH